MQRNSKEPRVVEKTDRVERMIESFPERYREYLTLESFFCDAHSMLYIEPGIDRVRAEKRLDELYRFFSFDFVRGKHNTVFWASSRIHSKAA